MSIVFVFVFHVCLFFSLGATEQTMLRWSMQKMCGVKGQAMEVASFHFGDGNIEKML